MEWDQIIPEIQQGNWQILLTPEVAMLIIGILLLVIGSRVYRLIIISPGFVCGALISKNFISGSSEVQLIATLVLGIVGAILLTSIERLAISIVGALLFGGVVFAVGPLIMGTVAWFIPVLAALVGSFVFPLIYKKVLPISTSLLGALSVAWALEMSSDTRIIVGLWVVGLVFQLLIGGKLKDKAD